MAIIKLSLFLPLMVTLASVASAAEMRPRPSFDAAVSCNHCVDKSGKVDFTRLFITARARRDFLAVTPVVSLEYHRQGAWHIIAYFACGWPSMRAGQSMTYQSHACNPIPVQTSATARGSLWATISVKYVDRTKHDGETKALRVRVLNYPPLLSYK